MNFSLQRSQPFIIAHRGASSCRPENTKAALDEALLQGADGIEIDVQLSKDHVPILFHDETLIKLGMGAARIRDFTLVELLKFDGGGWFSKLYAGERLLTLDELFILYGKRTTLFIEIKVDGYDCNESYCHLLVDSVLRAIHRFNLAERLFILCFDQPLLEYAHAIAPHLRYILNVDQPLSFDPSMQSKYQSLFALSYDIDRMQEGVPSIVQELKKPLIVYTCNRKEEVDIALKASVQAIMTDRPGWLTQVVRSPG